jgi:hypothetical protein
MSDVSVLPGQAWLAFTRDHDEDEASRTFEERFGQPPEYITESAGRCKMLLVGPVPGVEVTR